MNALEEFEPSQDEDTLKLELSTSDASFETADDRIRDVNANRDVEMADDTERNTAEKNDEADTDGKMDTSDANHEDLSNAAENNETDSDQETQMKNAYPPQEENGKIKETKISMCVNDDEKQNPMDATEGKAEANTFGTDDEKMNEEPETSQDSNSDKTQKSTTSVYTTSAYTNDETDRDEAMTESQSTENTEASADDADTAKNGGRIKNLEDELEAFINKQKPKEKIKHEDANPEAALPKAEVKETKTEIKTQKLKEEMKDENKGSSQIAVVPPTVKTTSEEKAKPQSGSQPGTEFRNRISSFASSVCLCENSSLSS